MRWTLLLVPAVLIAAAPSPKVDELVRQGNAAFANKDYAAALRFYEEAEPRTTDPGFVAGNKASALYQLALAARSSSERLGLFRQAAQHYRCAAEGADDARRLRTRFGLANSIMQGRAEEAAAVKEAVAAYRDCLNNPALDEGTADDVRHNLEVAKLQLLRLQIKPRDPEKTGDGPEDKPKQPETKKEPEPKNPPNGDPAKGMGTPIATETPAEAKDKQKPIETEKTAPGAGKARTIFDESPSPPLTAEDAETELTKAIDNIKERQKIRRNRSFRTPAGSVKDW